MQRHIRQIQWRAVGRRKRRKRGNRGSRCTRDISTKRIGIHSVPLQSSEVTSCRLALLLKFYDVNLHHLACAQRDDGLVHVTDGE